jgi:hypothetical protein
MIKAMFLLGWKKILTIIMIWTIAIILHSFIRIYLKIDEPFLFIFAVFVIPVYFFICLLYSMHHYSEGYKIEDEINNNS